MSSIISIDTEATGLDHWHGTMPYLVSVCKQDGTQLFWEWDVCPVTRCVSAPVEDCREIQGELDAADVVVLHNSKYDAHALDKIGVSLPWAKVFDTLHAGHLLASNQPHNLTDMAIHWLAHDIEPLEKRMKAVVEECRRLVQQARLRCKRHAAEPEVAEAPSWSASAWSTSALGTKRKVKRQGLSQLEQRVAGWTIAEKGHLLMPSLDKSIWKSDCWLPRALVAAEMVPDDAAHADWTTVTRDYANADSEATLALYFVLTEEVGRRRQGRILDAMMPRAELAYRMESAGITVDRDEWSKMLDEYRDMARQAEEACVGIAADYGYNLTMPKGGINKSLQEFCFGKQHLNLPPLVWTEGGEPSLKAEAIDLYAEMLPPGSEQLAFVLAMGAKRRTDKALEALEGYARFAVPPDEEATGLDPEKWWVIHAGFNPTGTSTLRWSSDHPNAENVSAKEAPCKLCKGQGCDWCNGTGEESFNLRRCFGPGPGREWWSLDYQNVERRLPAYRAGERSIIDLFERPNDPPYFGSEHLLVAHIIFHDDFETCRDENGQLDGRIFKKRFPAKYKRGKNFNFATQYQAGDATADRAAGVVGARAKVKARFAGQTALNEQCVRMAERLGHVETFADREVDPERGYPLLCARTERGGILGTIPLSYVIQGTACWIMARAMDKVQQKLDSWGEQDFDGRILVNVHDELVLDFPKHGDPRKDLATEKRIKGPSFRTSNLWRVRVVQRLMASCGDAVGVPCPVGVKWHPKNWAIGEDFT